MESRACFWALPVSAIHTGHLQTYWQNSHTHNQKTNLKRRKRKAIELNREGPTGGEKTEGVSSKTNHSKPEFWELNHPGWVTLLCGSGRWKRGQRPLWCWQTHRGAGRVWPWRTAVGGRWLPVLGVCGFGSILTEENLTGDTEWHLGLINIPVMYTIQICIWAERAGNLDKYGEFDGLTVLSTIVFQFISLLTLYKVQPSSSNIVQWCV